MPELVAAPDVDGVPTIAFAPGFSAGIVLATVDAIPFPLVGSSPWGLYRGAAQVIQADTVLAVDYKEDWVIADYPIERGGFESYNKVATPFDVRLVFAAGGTEANRAELLDSIAAIIGDLELYDVVTPEAVYPNVNIIHYDYRRTTQNGVGMLIVSIFCQEVRQAASGSEMATDPSAAGGTGDTAAASGADPVNGGTVQSTAPAATDITSAQGQGFAGGFNVGSYDPNGGGTLGNGNFGLEGVGSNPTFTADVGEAVFTDPSTGQVVAITPPSSSTISGNTPAGPY